MHKMLVGLDADCNLLYAIVDDEDYKELNKYYWNIPIRNGKPTYAKRNITENGRKSTLFMHQAVAGKPPKGFIIDHINRNKLDNRRENLRFISQRDNTRNSEHYSGNILFRASGYQVTMRFKTREGAQKAVDMLNNLWRELYESN